jgi:hypothetical protein
MGTKGGHLEVFMYVQYELENLSAPGCDHQLLYAQDISSRASAKSRYSF